MVKVLLNHHADIMVEDSKGKTASDHMAERNEMFRGTQPYPEILNLLKDARQKLTQNTNLKRKINSRNFGI